MKQTRKGKLSGMSDSYASERPKSVLLMGFQEGTRTELRGIFAAPQWEIREANDYDQAAGMLNNQQCGVFICDTAGDAADWRKVLNDLQRQSHAPNLIVSSRLADERLWAEVLNLGGYDVLAQPFDPAEVLRVTSMAWMSWQRTSEARPSRSLRMHAS